MKDSRLQKAIARLNSKQSNKVVLTLKCADIARLMRGCTINRAIKDLAKQEQDKAVKKALLALSKHDNVIAGVDFMFESGF